MRPLPARAAPSSHPTSRQSLQLCHRNHLSRSRTLVSAQLRVPHNKLKIVEDNVFEGVATGVHGRNRKSETLKTPLNAEALCSEHHLARSSDSRASIGRPSQALQREEFQKGKCVALAIIYVLAAYCSSILETIKDAIVITALGAEVLPVLSVVFILPTSICAMLLYNKLQDLYGSEGVYAIMLAFLVGFYGLFAAVLYPCRAALQPTQLGATVSQYLHPAFESLVKVLTNWVYSLFFAMCELWNPVVLSVLFYGTANEICSLSEARTLYPAIGIVANLSVVCAGMVVQFVIKHVAKASMTASLCILTATMAVAAVVMVMCKCFLTRKGYNKPQAQSPAATKIVQRNKQQGFLSVLDTLKQSRSISLLAILVACYGMSHKLFEFTWKGHLRSEFSGATDYQNLMAQVQVCTGVLTLFCMASARFVFTHLGWQFAASCTPVLLLFSGTAFFGLCLASKLQLTIFGTTPAALSTAGAYVGSVTQVFTRSTRYSFLDPAKEMSFLQMSDAERSQGKAAVDMVGSQIGKSGASCILQGLIIVFGSLAQAMPIIGLMFVVVLFLWLGAIHFMGNGASHKAHA